MKLLNLEDSMKLLQKYKIPTSSFKLSTNLNHAIKAAKEIGYPIAIKLVSPTITHKTDVGGVQLNIENEEQFKIAYERIIKKIRKKFPKDKIDGVLVQKMVQRGQEIIVGCRRDEQFGHFILFGLGGVFTEVFNDVSLRMVPISRKDAECMIREIKGSKILTGYRGKKYDIKSLKEILLKVSHLVSKNPKIKEMDINPVIVSNKDALAVDVRILFI